MIIGRAHPRMGNVPRDPWWPRRVKVAEDGGCVPFELMLYWHWQFWLITSEVPE